MLQICALWHRESAIRFVGDNAKIIADFDRDFNALIVKRFAISARRKTCCHPIKIQRLLPYLARERWHKRFQRAHRNKRHCSHPGDENPERRHTVPRPRHPHRHKRPKCRPGSSACPAIESLTDLEVANASGCCRKTRCFPHRQTAPLLRGDSRYRREQAYTG